MTTYEEFKRVYDATGTRINIDPSKRTAMELLMIKTWESGEIWEQDRCIVCGKRMEAEEAKVECMGKELLYAATVCFECEPVVDEHYSLNGVAKASEGNETFTPQWEEKCPQRFKDLLNGKIQPDENQKAAFDKAAFDKANKWEYGIRGMILVGSTGSGKTLSLWSLFRKLEMAGIIPIVMVASDLSRILSQHAKDLVKPIELWRTKVLMIDDMGKERITPAAASNFWELINERYQWNLPTIITTRFKGDDFQKRFDDTAHALGEDIRRRITDTCEGIPFKPKAVKTKELTKRSE